MTGVLQIKTGTGSVLPVPEEQDQKLVNTLPGAATTALERFPVVLAVMLLPLTPLTPVVEPVVARMDAPLTSALMLPELICDVTTAIGAIAPVPAAAKRSVVIDELPVASAISMLPFRDAEPIMLPVELMPIS